MNLDQILNKQFVMTDAMGGDHGRVDRIIDLYTTFNDQVDLQALKDGGYIEVVDKMMEPITMSLNGDTPEVLAYWAKLGMVKEFHGDHNVMSWTEYEAKTGYKWSYGPGRHGQNDFKKWNSFVPVSAFKPENKDKKYPVLFMLHGGFNHIGIVDGWGFPQEAAKREWILIAPSIELDDIIEEILEEAKTLYPIDESRVYVAGFSYGGFMSNFLGNKRPDLFAACAPCGAPISNGYTPGASAMEPQTPFDGVARCVAMNTYMPVINVAGNLDGFRFPLYDSIDRRSGTGESNTATLVEGINHWARANKCKEISLDEVMALKGRDDISDEEKYIGLPLAPEYRHTVVADGITNYIADIPSEDGIVRTKVMVEMNMPHWPTPEMCRQIFDFFSHFSRDPETKESIYTE